jgi:hypothetical protein
MLRMPPLAFLHSLPTRVTTLTSLYIWNKTLLPPRQGNLLWTSMSSISIYKRPSPRPNSVTPSLLTDAVLRLWTSRWETRYLSSPTISRPLGLPRNLQKNSLDPSKSLPKQVPTHLPFDSLPVCDPSTPSFMSLCLNLPLQTPSPGENQLRTLRSSSTENQSMRSLKFWTPGLTKGTSANYCTLFGGLGMKAQMKKLHGYQPPNSDMLMKSSWTFMMLILLSLVLCL